MSPLNKHQKKLQEGTEFILIVQMEILSFVNHSKKEERKWMIGFTSLDVQILILKVTELNKNVIFAKKIYSNVTGTKDKIKKLSVIKKCDFT